MIMSELEEMILESNVYHKHYEWAGEDNAIDLAEPVQVVYNTSTAEQQAEYAPGISAEESAEQDNYELAIKLDIEPWYQNDKRWGRIPYGPNSTWTTYAQAGCGCLSYCMVMEYYDLFADSLETTKDKVLALGTYAYKHGYRVKNKGTSSALFSTWTDCTKTKSVEKVKQAIDNGYPVILLVRADWSTYKGGGHYIVCYGYTDDGYLLINDPASSAINRRKVKIAGNWNSVAYAYICQPKDSKLR